MRDKSEYYLRIKKEVMNSYGGQLCSICGFCDIRALTIDHVFGGGRKHRNNTTKRGGYGFYLWLRKNGYPEGYRVLCANCNMSIGHHGFSPLEKTVENHCIKCSGALDNTLEFYKKYSINICEVCCVNGSNAKKAISSKSDALRYKCLVIENYGGECARCGETQPLFLTIDHINGGGTKDREFGKVGVSFYRELIQTGYPKGDLQLLCYNCNCGIKQYKNFTMQVAA